MEGENGAIWFRRPLPCRDILRQAVAEQPYLINWYQYDSKTQSLTAQDTTYTNYVLGYSIKIPEKWLSGRRGTDHSKTEYDQQ